MAPPWRGSLFPNLSQNGCESTSTCYRKALATPFKKITVTFLDEITRSQSGWGCRSLQVALKVSNPTLLLEAGPVWRRLPKTTCLNSTGVETPQPLLTTCCLVHLPSQQASFSYASMEFHIFQFVPAASCPGTTFLAPPIDLICDSTRALIAIFYVRGKHKSLFAKSSEIMVLASWNLLLFPLEKARAALPEFGFIPKLLQRSLAPLPRACFPLQPEKGSLGEWGLSAPRRAVSMSQEGAGTCKRRQ